MSSCYVLLFYVFVLLFTLGNSVRFSQGDSCDPSCLILPRGEGDREFTCKVHKEERCQDVRKELEKNQNSYPSFSMLNIPELVSSTVSDVTSPSTNSNTNNHFQLTDSSTRPQIAGLTIHDEQRSCPNDYPNSNNFVLNFTLLLPSGEYLPQTTGLLLKIDHDVHKHRDSKCRVFDFQNVMFPPETKYEKKYIQYNFLTYFQKFKTHVFQVKLIALPGGVNSTYIVTAYVNPLKVHKKRTIAVSKNTDDSRLHVVFEPSRQYVADSYNISLIRFSHFRDPYSSKVVQQLQLPGNKTEAEFINIQPGYYQIQVNVISADSQVQTMNSTSFTMGSPLKNSGRSMSSKTLTTTTAVLKHRISSTSGMVKNNTTSETRTISRRQDDVKMQPSDQSGEYERSLKIMLGTVFGVVGSVTIIIVVFCMYRKRNYTSGSHIEHPQLSDAIIEDFDMKQHFPNVLLLYSSDCAAHECAVQAVAAFLMQICNCNVHIDLFEEHVIQEKGLNDWLLDNLQEAEYIVVLCSVGSRLRCKKNMQFRQDSHRTIPDYFALAVDYVAEKMRIERCKGMSLSKFIVLYLDYSVEGDIPAQLDLAQKFQMMRDVSSLVCHLHGLSSERSKFLTYPGITAKNYDKSDVGLRLKLAIEQAKQYFKDNPSWVEDHLEPVPRPVGSKFKPKHTRHSSGEPLLLPEHNMEKTPNLKHMNRHTSLSHYLSSQRDIFGMYNRESSVPITNLVHSRLNSLPSSLNSHAATLTPFPMSTHTSHSYENISQGKKMQQELDMFCAEPNISLNLYPPAPPPPPPVQPQQQSPQSESEEGFEVLRGKSRSLPVVNRANKSLTVLEAEVHKEWDPESKLLSGSPPTEADSSSNEGELELDLLSIKMPPNFRHVFYTPNQNCVELQPCLCKNSLGGVDVGTSVVYRPAHKKGVSVIEGGGNPMGHRGSEDNRSLCRAFPTLEPLPRCVSLDDGSTTSYESVMDQIINGGATPNIFDGPFIG